MTQLRKIYGNNIPNPTSVVVTRWNRDPYARGSYSYNAVGATQQMRCVGQCDPPPIPWRLREQVGAHCCATRRSTLGTSICNVHFAGEHTSATYWATVHGAYYSGIDAGRKVQNSG
jgi:monoamine oxidase